ncbi:MAG: alcohol dehydrogenase [Chloroflexota bacterium]
MVEVETVLVMETAPIKFGVNATAEIAFDLRRLGVTRALLVTDRNLMKTGLPDRVRKLAAEGGVQVEIYDGVHVEPTDASLEAAVSFAQGRNFDGFISVGGGSSIDTAKVVNLLTTYPAPLLDYVNKPIGKGLPVPGPLKPHIAVPTTAGTGSETTAVAVLDIPALKVKTGISHRYLRPSLGIVDPLNTITCPPMVTAAAGLDVLTHAVESYTTRPYNARPKHNPAERPAYIGANPLSDIWCEKAIEYVGRYLRRAVMNGLDLEARTYMALAATIAGIGFGNAGVHIPHGLAYPVAGMVRNYWPPDYQTEEPLVPHGISVVVTAPAAFRFTYPAAPERHLKAAALLGADVSGVAVTEGAEVLPRTLIGLMRDVGIPNGLAALGYGEADIPALVEGALKQQRILVNSPRDVGAEELKRILLDAMVYW